MIYDSSLTQIPSDRHDALIVMASPIFFADRVRLSAAAATSEVAEDRYWMPIDAVERRREVGLRRRDAVEPLG
jgi:hypothetical protein